jgi:ring-1,2-phenylacetyl-CoA epoxidase subunit PaaD
VSRRTATATGIGMGPDLDRGLVELRRLVEAVPDPELPVLTLGQLGVIRDVRRAESVHVPTGSAAVTVEITPTYSGCPAIEVMIEDIVTALAEAGHPAEVRVVLSPAWTTDSITPEGRAALRAAGIAPPGPVRGGPVRLALGRREDHPAASHGPSCPQCGSADVEELARFGSTACKALWRCRSCREPFDYVKPL